MAKIDRTRNASRNFVFGTFLRIYQIAVPFFMRTAMIYFLGVQYLGLNSLFTSILQVLNLTELGVGSAMVYSMYKPIAEDDSITICALMKLYRFYYRIIGLVIAVIGLALIPFLSYLISGDIPSDININVLYLLNLGATVLSYWLFSYRNSILQAYQRNDILSKITLATNTFQYVAQLFALWFFHNYYLFVTVVLLSQILNNIITAAISSKLYPKYHPIGEIDETKKKEINKRIKDVFTAKIGYVVNSSADTIIISAFLGLTILAVYNNYYYIINSVMGFVMIVFDSVLAGIGNSLITESKEKNYNDLKKLSFIIFWISNFCSCSFICMFQPFMKLWVGEELMLPYGCVIMITVYFYILVARKIWVVMEDAAGIWHYDRFRPLITAIVNLTLNIVLVQFIGLYGIMLSTILAELVISIPWLIHTVFKYILRLGKREYLISLSLYTFIGILSCIICTQICAIFRLAPLFTLIINAVVCILVPNLIQLLVYRKTPEFKQSVVILRRLLKIDSETNNSVNMKE